MGLTEDKIQKIRLKDPDIFSDRELAAIRWSDLVIAEGNLEDQDEIVKAVKQHFSYQEIAEISTFIGMAVGFTHVVHTLEL